MSKLAVLRRDVKRRTNIDANFDIDFEYEHLCLLAEEGALV